MKQSASPAAIIAAVIVLVLIVGGLWYKFLGPGSNPTIPDPTAGMHGGTGMPADSQPSSGGGVDTSIPGMGQGTGTGGGATPSR
ncbi:MAG: hypothetical protein NZT92_14405 [Abditibacteriales bacterium]|nr:hypothetical protein [Abditibacteriales bacterium]